MNPSLFALSLGFGGVILATQIAHSQPSCGPRDDIVVVLAERYGETRQALGLTDGAVMELFAASGTGTWTLAFTMPDGSMCVVAAGTDYEPAAPALVAQGDPA